jgi:hypothetical protein
MSPPTSPLLARAQFLSGTMGWCSWYATAWASDRAWHQDRLADWTSVVTWLWLWSQSKKLIRKKEARVEAVSNNSTVALRFVGGDGKGTQCLGVKLGHPVSGGNKYRDLALQVGGVSSLREQNMVISPAGLGLENYCAGEDQKQL